MPDETSSVGSEEVQTTPDMMNYINQGYHNNNDDDDDDDQNEDEFDRVNFGTFFPPPPPGPPPPIPDSESGSVASEEESINSESDDDSDYINAVLPPHGDFADTSFHPENAEEPSRHSPTDSFTGSTAQLVSPGSYKDSLLPDPTFAFGNLRRSSNSEQTTEL
jgi:hypothetical protein